MLSITRDGGADWREVPPPNEAGEVVFGVGVLRRMTIAVTPAAESASEVSIDTLAAGATSWTTEVVPAGVFPTEAEAVESGGGLAGLTVNERNPASEGRGVWLAAGEGGAWHAHRTPVPGSVTDAGGLWLVGGQQPSPYSKVYRSDDGGSSWQPVKLPTTLRSSEPLEMSPVEVSGDEAVITAKDETETQVIVGVRDGGGWRWRAGPTLRLGGRSVGIPASTSLADGVLWVRSPVNRIARVTLATGEVSDAAAKGLPVEGELTVHATGSLTAWAAYDTEACAKVKGDCTHRSGLLATTDGGASWHQLSRGSLRPAIHSITSRALSSGGKTG